MSDETTPEPQVSAPIAWMNFYVGKAPMIDSAGTPGAIRSVPMFAGEVVDRLIDQRDRLLSALRKLVNEPQDITSKAYQHALGVLGEFDSQQEK